MALPRKNILVERSIQDKKVAPKQGDFSVIPPLPFYPSEIVCFGGIQAVLASQSAQSAIHPNNVTKVFTPMRLPEQFAESKVEPLLIYWMPMSNSTDANPEPFFQIPVRDLGLPDTFVRAPFKTLSIFSVSLYFRKLLKGGTETLELPMPNAERRVQVLNEIGRE
jgi:hypothetical protein